MEAVSQYPECATEGCTLRARTFHEGAKCRSCRAAEGDPKVRCVTDGCPNLRVTRGLCKSCTKAGKPGNPPRTLRRDGKRPLCKTPGCGHGRYRADLCYRCYGSNPLPPCGRKGCGNFATCGTYCRRDDVGIDWVAGNWFDWVAVDQMWQGRQDPDRKPTVPELNALFDRAERAGIGPRALAGQVGVDEPRLNAWRQMLGRIVREGSDIAAEVAA